MLKPSAQDKIKSSFLAQMTKNPHDFLGYIPNQTAKLGLNSLLRGKSHDKVYDAVDPRKAQSRRKRSSPRIDPNQASIPHRYQQHYIDLSNRGLDGFDFGRYNQTIFAGLETSTAQQSARRTADATHDGRAIAANSSLTQLAARYGPPSTLPALVVARQMFRHQKRPPRIFSTRQ